MIPRPSTMNDLQQLRLQCARTVALIDSLIFAHLTSERERTLRHLPSTLRLVSTTVAHTLASLDAEGIH